MVQISMGMECHVHKLFVQELPDWENIFPKIKNIPKISWNDTLLNFLFQTKISWNWNCIVPTWMDEANSAPNPLVNGASWVTITRPVFLADSKTVSSSHGKIETRSITSQETPNCKEKYA